MSHVTGHMSPVISSPFFKPHILPAKPTILFYNVIVNHPHPSIHFNQLKYSNQLKYFFFATKEGIFLTCIKKEKLALFISS